MLIVYNVVIIILFLLLLPLVLGFIIVRPSLVREGSERLGIFSKQCREYINLLRKEQKDVIWVNAASVGELMMARTMIGEIGQTAINSGFIVSTNSRSGIKMAQELFGPEKSFLLPLDLPWITKKLAKKIKPKITIFVEFESWPNLIHSLSQAGNRLVLVNGSMTNKILKYYTYFPGLLEKTLNKLDFLCMQSMEGVEKVKSCGVKETKIRLTGNMKIDSFVKIVDEQEKHRLRKGLHLPDDADILIAGSTHSGEEEIFIRIFPELKEEFKNLVLIIAPRHIERTNEIKRLGEMNNLAMIESTKIGNTQGNEEHVIILDTIGELAKLYSLGTVVFIGGSLVNTGGHNLYEPVIYGKPVIFGPYIQDFKQSADLLVEKEIGFLVNNEDELKNKIIFLLQDPNHRRLIKEKADELLEDEGGAMKKTMDIIYSLLR